MKRRRTRCEAGEEGKEGEVLEKERRREAKLGRERERETEIDN